MAYRRIAFDLRVCTHTDQFRNVHETVFKDRFGNHAGPFRNQVQQRELRLHVGREPRVWRGAYIDGFRTIAVHIQANPVFAGFDISARIAQLGQYGIQGIRLCVAANNFTAGDCRSDQESTGFDTVRQNAVYAATQTLYAFDGDAVSPLTFNFRAQRVEEVRRIDDFRLASGVFNNGGAFRQRRGTHNGHGRADADLIHHNMRAFKTSVNRRLHITFFQFDLCAQLLKADNMQIDRTRTDSTTARQ